MKYIIKRKLLLGHYPSSKGKDLTYKVAFKPWNKIAVWCDGVKIEQVGICFEGGIMVFVHKASQSPPSDIVKVWSRQDISNPLLSSLECYERITRRVKCRPKFWWLSFIKQQKLNPSSCLSLPQLKERGIQKLHWDHFHSGQSPTRWVSSVRVNPSASSNCHTMTRSICWGRVEHLQLRNHRFCVRRKSRGLMQNSGNVWSRRWSEPYFLSNHKFCDVNSSACARDPEVLRGIGGLNSCGIIIPDFSSLPFIFTIEV